MSRSSRTWIAALPLALAVAAPVAAVETQLKSPAFQHGQPIPKRHTCDGANASVPLTWPKGPDGTKTFVVIAEDPTVEAGSLTHWVIYDIPATTQSLPAGIPARATLKSGARQTKNGLGKMGYSGPCPAPGKPHQYWFRVYAIDRALDVGPTPTVTDVRDAMRKHVLSVAELMGTYARPTPPLPPPPRR